MGVILYEDIRQVKSRKEGKNVYYLLDDEHIVGKKESNENTFKSISKY